MIYELIEQTLIHQLGIDESLVKPEASIENDLELDSTETVILALEIKKKFNVDYKFPAQDVTLAEVASSVEQLIKVSV